MLQAIVSTFYPNRVALYLGSIYGPLMSAELGDFDPSRDLELYVSGERITVASSNFDASQNRYLIFADRVFDVTGVVQVVHHMPRSPFIGSAQSPTGNGFGLSFGGEFYGIEYATVSSGFGIFGSEL